MAPPPFSTSLLSLQSFADQLAVLLDEAFHAASAGAEPAELARVLAEHDAKRVCRPLNDKAADFDDHAAAARPGALGSTAR
ncbi:MAG: hypothetical protein U0792_03390 [Gemmataceae bacterium]